MKRTLLRFENVQQVVGGDGMAVIILTDGERKATTDAHGKSKGLPDHVARDAGESVTGILRDADLWTFRGPVSGYADE